jgi:hypothetical protein
VFVAIVRGERTGVLISCLLAVLSVVAEEGVWGGGGREGEGPDLLQGSWRVRRDGGSR